MYLCPFLVLSSVLLLRFSLRPRAAERRKERTKNDVQLFRAFTSPSRRMVFADLFSTSKLVMVTDY
jgi:hypothetical protein